MRKPVFGISDQVQHKPWAVQPQKMVKRLEISDLRSRGFFFFFFLLLLLLLLPIHGPGSSKNVIGPAGHEHGI